MPNASFPDEWLAHSLEGVVTPDLLAQLREKAGPQATLWETLVAQKVASDEQILNALSSRLRLKLADVHQMDPAAKERVPEAVARRYQILPLRATDSYLEVATANPFDLDAEKALAFATAREIRMLLLAPSPKGFSRARATFTSSRRKAAWRCGTVSTGCCARS